MKEIGRIGELTLSQNMLVELPEWFTKISDSGLRARSTGPDD